MEFIIVFFRDILDGPLYIVVCVFCLLLICSCIGYLGERYLNKKKQKQTNQHATSHVEINDAQLNPGGQSVSLAQSMGATLGEVSSSTITMGENPTNMTMPGYSMGYPQQQNVSPEYLQQQQVTMSYPQQQPVSMNYPQQQDVSMGYPQQSGVFMGYPQQQDVSMGYPQQPGVFMGYPQQQTMLNQQPLGYGMPANLDDPNSNGSPTSSNF